MTIELKNTDTIEAWRRAKEHLDSNAGYRNQLGCVGEPLADVLDKVLQLVADEHKDYATRVLNEASTEARGNLLEYVNDARQQGADEVLDDIATCVSFDEYDIELDTKDTLGEVAERGFDSCLSQITNQVWSVTEMIDENL